MQGATTRHVSTTKATSAQIKRDKRTRRLPLVPLATHAPLRLCRKRKNYRSSFIRYTVCFRSRSLAPRRGVTQASLCNRGAATLSVCKLQQGRVGVIAENAGLYGRRV